MAETELYIFMIFKPRKILAFGLLMAFPVSFANTNDVINASMLERDRAVLQEKATVANLIKISIQEEAAIKHNKKAQEIISSLKSKEKKTNLIKIAPRAVIFVSLGMPQLALKQFMNDGYKYNVPVVIRGLYHNSFQETVDKIFALIKENKRGGVLVDPIWFKDFGIESVPAFVVQQNGKFDVVYGNIPFKRALTLVYESGEAAEVAKFILKENGDAY
jgi:type-F conjugative transfer system pilin assembly protein TrbC